MFTAAAVETSATTAVVAIQVVREPPMFFSWRWRQGHPLLQTKFTVLALVHIGGFGTLQRKCPTHPHALLLLLPLLSLARACLWVPT